VVTCRSSSSVQRSSSKSRSRSPSRIRIGSDAEYVFQSLKSGTSARFMRLSKWCSSRPLMLSVGAAASFGPTTADRGETLLLLLLLVVVVAGRPPMGPESAVAQQTSHTLTRRIIFATMFLYLYLYSCTHPTLRVGLVPRPCSGPSLPKDCNREHRI
jgi:hypothetical protein